MKTRTASCGPAQWNAVEEDKKPIGVFDSGYGGLTILREFARTLPAYDFLYLGDNARSPYGARSFETVYHFTLECVRYLFHRGCHLVVLACNTASAKALRTIQQHDLAGIAPDGRVLGVIRPTTEMVGTISRTKTVGIFATAGTVASNSYAIEIAKFFPGLTVVQEACPMWVPLVENHEYDSPGADYFVKKHIDNLLTASDQIDTVILACTHYPLLMEKIRKFLPASIQIISQGPIVAASLEKYLTRHSEIEKRCRKNGEITFYTTDATGLFDAHASDFFGAPVHAEYAQI